MDRRQKAAKIKKRKKYLRRKHLKTFTYTFQAKKWGLKQAPKHHLLTNVSSQRKG